MKNNVLLIIFIAGIFNIYGQIGASFKRINNFIDKDQIIRTNAEGGYLLQDIKIAKNEVVVIGYKDSTAVLVAYGKKDSAYTNTDLQNFIKNNIPKFKANIKSHKMEQIKYDSLKMHTGKILTTYHWDTANKILILINYTDYGKGAIMSGFAGTIDKDIIASWVFNLTGWKKE